MTDTNFYEDDEPVEDIEEILRRQADGYTGVGGIRVTPESCADAVIEDCVIR